MRKREIKKGVLVQLRGTAVVDGKTIGTDRVFMVNYDWEDGDIEIVDPSNLLVLVVDYHDVSLYDGLAPTFTGVDIMSDERYTLAELEEAGVLTATTLDEILVTEAKEVIKNAAPELAGLADQMTSLGIPVNDLETFQQIKEVIEQVQQRYA